MSIGGWIHFLRYFYLVPGENPDSLSTGREDLAFDGQNKGGL